MALSPNMFVGAIIDDCAAQNKDNAQVRPPLLLQHRLDFALQASRTASSFQRFHGRGTSASNPSPEPQETKRRAGMDDDRV
jgi:hypothetical protein